MKSTEKRVDYRYKSATCSINTASDMANQLFDEGYSVKYCFPIVVVDDGSHVNAIYLFVEKRDAV